MNTENDFIRILSRPDYKTIIDMIIPGIGIDITIVMDYRGYERQFQFDKNEAEFILSHNWTLEEFSLEYFKRQSHRLYGYIKK